MVKQLLELENKELFQKIFSPLNNQPTNRYLKEIMKDLQINKTMNFHRARSVDLLRYSAIIKERLINVKVKNTPLYNKFY